MKTESREYATQLQKLRLTKGLTQNALAVATGIPAPRLSLIENGGARPSKQAAIRIAEALGLEPVRVFPNFDSLHVVNRAPVLPRSIIC